MVAVGVVRYAPIASCQRMVGRISGSGDLQGPGAASIGAVESELLATVLTKTHAVVSLMPGLRGRGEDLTLAGEGPENLR